MSDTYLSRELGRFMRWWKGHEERRQCTLEQAVGAYLRTFPGRALPLLVELIERAGQEDAK